MQSDTRAPWHHFPVAILAALFYLAGAVDYLLTKLQFGPWLQNFTAEQVSFFTGFPFWLDLVWAVGVWGGLLGAWLLWKRNRYSVLVLLTAFLCLVFLTLWVTLFTRPTLVGVAGFLGLYVMAGTCALAFVVYLYARWERTEHYLA